METIKNFFTGLLVVILSLVVLAIVAVTWPFIIGLGSVILSVIAGILLFILIFYIITFVGYLTRQILKKKGIVHALWMMRNTINICRIKKRRYAEGAANAAGLMTTRA